MSDSSIEVACLRFGGNKCIYLRTKLQLHFPFSHLSAFLIVCSSVSLISLLPLSLCLLLHSSYILFLFLTHFSDPSAFYDPGHYFWNKEEGKRQSVCPYDNSTDLLRDFSSRAGFKSGKQGVEHRFPTSQLNHLTSELHSSAPYITVLPGPQRPTLSQQLCHWEICLGMWETEVQVSAPVCMPSGEAHPGEKAFLDSSFIQVASSYIGQKFLAAAEILGGLQFSQLCSVLTKVCTEVHSLFKVGEHKVLWQ